LGDSDRIHFAFHPEKDVQLYSCYRWYRWYSGATVNFIFTTPFHCDDKSITCWTWSPYVSAVKSNLLIRTLPQIFLNLAGCMTAADAPVPPLLLLQAIQRLHPASGALAWSLPLSQAGLSGTVSSLCVTTAYTGVAAEAAPSTVRSRSKTCGGFGSGSTERV
jgi:hypothetical protein